MKLVNVALERVKGSYAEGWILSDELSVEQLSELGIEEGDSTETVEVEADFEVNRDDDIFMVAISKVHAYNGGLKIDITDLINLDRLEKEIEEDGYGQFYEDFISSGSDYDYDQER